MKKDKDNDNAKMTRRTFIKKTGAAVFVITWGGLTWRAFDQGVFSTGKGAAYEAWNNRYEAEGSLALVHDAILASNPHNTQPWLFKVTENQIDLFADDSRHLGAFDPFKREMYIGLGCAIENLVLSANAYGYNPTVQYNPYPLQPTCIASIYLEKGRVIDTDLYRAIPHRHTHRGAYDTTKNIPTNLLKEMESLCVDEKKVNITWFTSNEQKHLIGDLTVKATEAIVADIEMSDASNKWYKENWKEIQENRDGITLDAQGEPFWLRAIGKMLPPLSQKQNDEFWVNATREKHVATAAAFGLISVRDENNKEERVRAGRAWQRIHLYGATKELGMHPLNQLNEISDREKILGSTQTFSSELKKLPHDSTWKGIFLFRLGYPLKETFPSPRRPIEEVLL